MKKSENIILKPVSKYDTEFLYELLKQRDPKQNISHRKMPNYNQHIKFVTTKPYAFWYILIENEENIGSVYLTGFDEIGMSFMKGKKAKGLEEQVLKLIMNRHPRKRFFVNISTKNKKLELQVKKFGFKIIQKTYEIERELNEEN
jgi:hypothetical protein|tara:strand:- start:187 stop:621 length:435 start_codon:yes stop_codon:yes gene_type:complete